MAAAALRAACANGLEGVQLEHRLACPHLQTGSLGLLLWLPHGYSWFTVGLVPLFAYKPHDLAAVLSTYGALTYVVPKIFLPVEETMSMY